MKSEEHTLNNNPPQFQCDGIGSTSWFNHEELTVTKLKLHAKVVCRRFDHRFKVKPWDLARWDEAQRHWQGCSFSGCILPRGICGAVHLDASAMGTSPASFSGIGSFSFYNLIASHQMGPLMRRTNHRTLANTTHDATAMSRSRMIIDIGLNLTMIGSEVLW